MKDNEPQVIFATGASLRDTVAADPGDVRVGIPHSHKPGGTSGSSGGRKGVERRRFRCMFYVISFIILLVIVAAVVLLALQASRGSTQFVLKGIGAGRVAHDNVTDDQQDVEQLANELSRWRWDDYVVMASSILALSLGVLFLIINPPISIGFLVCAAALALSLWRLRDCAIGRDLWDSVAVLRIENAKLSSSVSELRLINQDLSQSVENLNDISDHLNVSVRTLQIQTDQLNSSLVTLSNLNGNLSLAIDNLASNNEELGDNLLAVKALRDELQVQLKEESLALDQLREITELTGMKGEEMVKRLDTLYMAYREQNDRHEAENDRQQRINDQYVQLQVFEILDQFDKDMSGTYTEVELQRIVTYLDNKYPDFDAAAFYFQAKEMMGEQHLLLLDAEAILEPVVDGKPLQTPK